MSQLLFADDDEDMRQLVHDLLVAAGHEVRVVPDGRAALDALAEQPPDLLMLDLMMPKLSGIEVCRAVKSNPSTAHIPVLMLTALGEVESKLEGFEAGADEYLAKPFDSRELRARVSSLLRLVRREGDRNPTSGLPGGRAIEEELHARAQRNEPYTVIYLDLDHFKAFSDHFGFAAGDRVIRAMGQGLRRAAVVLADGDGLFLGHVGGDDFIVVTGTGRAKSIAEGCAAVARDAIRAVVDPDTAARGVFSGVDREGTSREFPLASVSVAILEVPPARAVSLAEIGARAAELKRRAKRAGGTIVTDSV